MKKIPSILLLALLIGAIAIPPTEAFAKRGSDDSHQEDREDDSGRHGRHHDSFDDSDDDFDDSSSSISSSTRHALEIEADVFTDTTIIKVELKNGRKVIFETTADTKAEVVEAIIAKVAVSKAEVEAVLDFEIEARASRPKERARLSLQSNSNVQNSDLREQITKLQQLIELLLARLAASNT